MSPRRARAGLTKLEVILVALTLLVLVGMLLPSVMSLRQAALRAQCMNNLRSIGFAVDNYHDAHEHYPQGTIPNSLLKPERRLSWMMAIQPFVEASDIYAKTDKSGAWDSFQNQPRTMISWKLYQCPWGYDPKAITTCYLGVAGVGADAATLETNDPRAGCFGHDRIVRKSDCVDGTSNTILIAESALGGPWAQGGSGTVRRVDPDYQPLIGLDSPLGSHNVASTVLLVDGSARTLSVETSPELIGALVTIRGGETVPEYW